MLRFQSTLLYVGGYVCVCVWGWGGGVCVYVGVAVSPESGRKPPLRGFFEKPPPPFHTMFLPAGTSTPWSISV